jgi:hypothetical protein
MRRYTFFSILLLATLLACNLNLAGANPGEDQPTQDSRELVNQVVSQTFEAQTRVALSVQQTVAAMVTNTASRTLQPTSTFTPETTRVTVSIETNCRTGPGTAYDVLGVLKPGVSAEVIGRNASSDTWIIRLPSNPAISCWLWGYYSTVTGNIAGLPIYTPPPTPTPALNFSIAYLGVTNCGPQYAFRFRIENTGSNTWESLRILVTDNTTATTFTHILDSFRSYNGCGIEGEQQDLMPGEGGAVANINPGQLNYDPTGHSITAAFHVCSSNGLGGACLDKTLNFTP